MQIVETESEEEEEGGGERARERVCCLQCNRYRKHDEVAMHMDVYVCMGLIVPLEHRMCKESEWKWLNCNLPAVVVCCRALYCTAQHSTLLTQHKCQKVNKHEMKMKIHILNIQHSTHAHTHAHTESMRV